ncbi:MAG: hypothetical protein AABZ36_01900, partial [Nitrospirota bacterium]
MLSKGKFSLNLYYNIDELVRFNKQVLPFLFSRLQVINTEVVQALTVAFVNRWQNSWEGSELVFVSGNSWGESLLNLYILTWKVLANSKLAYHSAWNEAAARAFVELLEWHIEISHNSTAIFNIAFDHSGNLLDIWSMPQQFGVESYEYVAHYNRISNRFQATGRDFSDCILRGTILGKLGDDGFVRLDPPIDITGFLKLKLGKDNLSKKDKARYEEILTKEIIDVINFLLTYVNLDKELVLLDELKEIFARQYGVAIPEKCTLGEFAKGVYAKSTQVQSCDITQLGFTQTALKKQAKVVDPLGIHA